MVISQKVRIFFIFIFLMGLSACAVDRSTVSVEAPEDISNPVNGVEVKLVTVTDDRVFEFKPATPDIPSLSESEIANTDIKARAFARKRNSYGQALGDVILPEGQTVAGIMRRALMHAFRSAGYRVIEPGDPGYENAVPVDAKIIQFWSWIEWGFWELGVRNRAEVSLKAPTGKLDKGVTVLNEIVTKHSAVFDSDWQQSATAGMQGISAKITEELKRGQ
ncbi:flagellar biosynthesis protein [Sneathiella chungangensis]|uniref:Flagellar biosynthesis protein n=1 Tax=Sneathiella chungangensis TaxID=1418234 RepID=A0A845MD29_9PROT|nr:flagellar biosynthesis protein [Sneathiella chungangensis]MZR21226.1 flagellar biosynthesis protein [Sneathiella chungangensis]